MSVRTGCGLSTGADLRVAAAEAGTDVRLALGGRPADLAVVFCSGGHLADPRAALEGAHEALSPAVLTGCGAGGVLGRGREHEGVTAVAVWAAALGDAAAAEPFHARADRDAGGRVSIDGLPDAEGGSAILLLPDPYSFPADRALAELGGRAPGTPVVGGLSSARTLDGEAALFLDDRVLGDGAVGVVLRGVEVLPCVSQGAAPVGPLLQITEVDGHVIRELNGRSALRVLREAMESLDGREREMVAGGLLLGVDLGEGDGGHDFLVRGIIGADPAAETVTVGAPVEPGRLVRLHARDAASAGRDLREALELRRSALGADPAGALVFTCNGRGRNMFGMPDHDSGLVAELLGGAPSAGFFAAGEIGPVGGENVLHGFTATVAVFAAD